MFLVMLETSYLEDELVELESSLEPSWPKLVEPLEKLVDRLQVVWGAVNHLKAVKDTAELRTAIEEIQLPRVAGPSSRQYTVAIRLTVNDSLISGSPLNKQSARTCGTSSDVSISSELVSVKWNEIFFFKIESSDDYIVEFIVTDMGKGDPVGYFWASLNLIAGNQDTSDYIDYTKALKWIEFSSLKSHELPEGNTLQKSSGRIKCAVFLSRGSDDDFEGSC